MKHFSLIKIQLQFLECHISSGLNLIENAVQESWVPKKGNHSHTLKKIISCGQLYVLNCDHTIFCMYVSIQTHPDVI